MRCVSRFDTSILLGKNPTVGIYIVEVHEKFAIRMESFVGMIVSQLLHRSDILPHLFLWPKEVFGETPSFRCLVELGF